MLKDWNNTFSVHSFIITWASYLIILIYTGLMINDKFKPT